MHWEELSDEELEQLFRKMLKEGKFEELCEKIDDELVQGTTRRKILITAADIISGRIENSKGARPIDLNPIDAAIQFHISRPKYSKDAAVVEDLAVLNNCSSSTFWSRLRNARQEYGHNIAEWVTREEFDGDFARNRLKLKTFFESD